MAQEQENKAKEKVAALLASAHSKNKTSPLMQAITETDHPCDHLDALAKIAAFIADFLTVNPDEDSICLGKPGKQGLFWIMRIMENGIQQIADLDLEVVPRRGEKNDDHNQRTDSGPKSANVP